MFIFPNQKKSAKSTKIGRLKNENTIGTLNQAWKWFKATSEIIMLSQFCNKLKKVMAKVEEVYDKQFLKRLLKDKFGHYKQKIERNK